MATEQAFCRCGRNLDAKQVDLPSEHVTHAVCPHCHKKVTIVYGKGKVKVRVEK